MHLLKHFITLTYLDLQFLVLLEYSWQSPKAIFNWGSKKHITFITLTDFDLQYFAYLKYLVVPQSYCKLASGAAVSQK